jgi:GNAT superfamily N-acetyltransferase
MTAEDQRPTTECAAAHARSARASAALAAAFGTDPVHPDSQGQGLATNVVAEVEAQARAAGFATLALRTEQPRNVALYQHLGFELHGIAPAKTSRLEVAVLSKPI